ncbi:ATP-binding protein [Pseudonocardia sp. CA-107938]|uniref:ATP-binding protein n=1 Tax=Pseudonocardia sp. CA-107938 TaxID=3240021 RepID=UPI003D8CEAF7
MERVGSPGPGNDAPRPAPAGLERRLGGPESLAELRRWIRTHVIAVPDVLADAQLISTELASNAIEHAPGPRIVRLTATATEFTAEVDDAAPDSPLTLGVSRLGDHRGRGLLLVNALARWGVRRTATGKTVWAPPRPALTARYRLLSVPAACDRR